MLYIDYVDDTPCLFHRGEDGRGTLIVRGTDMSYEAWTELSELIP